MEIVYIFIAVIFLVVVWYISVSNSIKVADMKVDEAEAGIDVALTKRYDVLTKMLDTVKGYQKHERTLFTDIVRLRKGMSIAEKNEINKGMDKAMRDINVMAEGYPELFSNVNFVELQKAIVDVEEHLQAARRLYNANVKAYNSKIIVFPNSIVANNMHAVKKDFFEAEDMKKQDVKMDFDN